MNITNALTINKFNMVTVAFIQIHIRCMYKFHISTSIDKWKPKWDKKKYMNCIANEVSIFIQHFLLCGRLIHPIMHSNVMTAKKKIHIWKKDTSHNNTHKSSLFHFGLQSKHIQIDLNGTKNEKKSHIMPASIVNFLKLLSNWRCKCYINDSRMALKKNWTTNDRLNWEFIWTKRKKRSKKKVNFVFETLERAGEEKKNVIRV